LETFFLAIFAFGALFTLASAALGAVHGFGHGHGVHVHHAPAHGHAAVHHGDATTTHGDVGWLRQLPLLNGSAAMGFLTWFGAAGYLLMRLSDWALPAVIVGAALGGTVGALLIARYLGFVLKGESEMDPADYRLEGTVGQITISIPQGGTGEIVFSKVGARRSEAARSLGDKPIPRGTEVVITNYADGFATVQPWAEFLAAREGAAADHTERHRATP
jgi:membrane protein implicated in regulation of membrane protease activity